MYTPVQIAALQQISTAAYCAGALHHFSPAEISAAVLLHYAHAYVQQSDRDDPEGEVKAGDAAYLVDQVDVYVENTEFPVELRAAVEELAPAFAKVR